MRKKMGFAITLVVAVGLAIFISFLSVDNQREDGPKITSNPAPITNNQTRQRPHVMNVDALKSYQKVQNHLNNHPKVTVIDHNGKDKSHYHDGQVVVNFKKKLPKTEIDRMLKEINGKLLQQNDSSYIFSSYKLAIPELIKYFDSMENVEFTEPNYILIKNAQPNDLLYNDYQWNLRMIETENGWGFSRGADNVVIAVIDTGVDLDHPDLAGRITNGYNLVKENQTPDDDNGHGTHVAGIIASKTNNHEGIAGITWFNPIMPIKAMGPDGYGSSFDIARGIIWATDNGADVINMSLGNYQKSKMLKHAVDYAYQRDVIMVAASGNDNSSQPSYPAAFPQVLSVAAVDDNGDRAEFSNYGNYIDVSAPGVDIPSTYIDHQYAALSGTSMAAPHVTALAALIRSRNPSLSNKEVIKIIKQTSIDLGKAGKDNLFGEGLIDIVSALERANK
ncbi:S8 family peptidase [Ferdinandcohnia quinoae]|uniref:S8 family peptidase n=1 Tax=Fredinandcohnia quinoae TaxID=2918902 RepID=A0AAW5DY75_9BACI|nr:S8 family peptidase [Fredinandcohnia sp. SECRCQ15]MCH1625591.1 S8 family peptidase [Fredinandcohnia sp. SECRCQ15]